MPIKFTNSSQRTLASAESVGTATAMSFRSVISRWFSACHTETYHQPVVGRTARRNGVSLPRWANRQSTNDKRAMRLVRQLRGSGPKLPFATTWNSISPGGHSVQRRRHLGKLRATESNQKQSPNSCPKFYGLIPTSQTIFSGCLAQPYPLLCLSFCWLTWRTTG